jgi:hypothetical protein
MHDTHNWIPNIQTHIVVDYLDTQWEILENLLYDTLADNNGNVSASITYVAGRLKEHVEIASSTDNNPLSRQLVSAAINSVWWNNVATHYLLKAKQAGG